jgi:hypothetical protein
MLRINVIKLCVTKLNVIVLNAVVPNVLLLIVIVLGTFMLSVIIPRVVVLIVAAPFQNCVIHPECNDPIFRCFDLAKAASKLANKTPGTNVIKLFTVVIYKCS